MFSRASQRDTSVYWLQQTEADVSTENDWLGASEIALLGHLRFAKRRSDWRLGRWTAKCATALYLHSSLDPKALVEIEIRPSLSGAPEVRCRNQPAPVSISLSHRAGMGLCTISGFGVSLGCDLEMIEPHSEAFIADYFAAEEQALIDQAPAPDRSRVVSLLWSAKESALKAMHAGLRLDTRDVVVSFPDDSELEARDEGRLKRQQNSYFPSSSACSDCYPLQVRHVHGLVFHGWWQQEGEMLKTLVSAVPTPRPISLEPAKSLPVGGAAR